MLGAIIQAILSGFIIGGLARWAVPGPDPMPFWMTVLLGLLGSAIGGSIAVALFGRALDRGTVFAGLALSIGAASGLLVAYRRFVQHRPLTGPDAYRPPARPPRKLRDIFGSPARRAYEKEDAAEQLRKLGQLHDEGVVSDEEFERKKAELLARL
ncbi:MAG: SHOCT domain-containing protein [Gaiellaceae bacterium]